MRLTFTNAVSPDRELAPGEISVGATAEDDIQVVAPGVQANHVRLHFDESGLWLRNHGPVVHVNARPVRELALLRAGDRVHLGTAEFLLQSMSTPRPPPAEPMPPLQAREIPHGVLVLRGLGERFAGQAIALGEHLGIGAAADARIAMDPRYAAPAEAHLSVMHDCVMIMALSPVSPLVNGYPVRKALLEAGDQIEVRGLRFVLEAPGLSRRNQCEVRAEEAAILADYNKHAADTGTPRRQGMLVRLLVMALVLAAAITLLLTYPPPA